MAKRKKKDTTPAVANLIVWPVMGFIGYAMLTGDFKEPATVSKTEVVEQESIADIIEGLPVELVHGQEILKDNGKEALINFVMHDIEGGSKYIKDGKGWAKYGINSYYNPDVNVKNLTARKAAEIYVNRYWDERLDSYSPAFQAVAFDALVNHGNDKDTWIMIDAAKGNPAKLISMRKRYYARLIEVNPDNKKNKAGWNSRLVKLAEYKLASN